MLFTSKINDVQSAIEGRLDLITQLEAQIEALRQENLEQQQFLQALGSAEAAAESALTQVQTAIAMINHVDEDQLQVFKDAILSAFNGNAPILPPDTDPSGGPAEDTDDSVVEVEVEVEPSDEDQALEIAMSFTTTELKTRLQALGHQSPKGNKRTLAQLLVDEWTKQGGQVSANNDYPMAA